MRSSWLVISLLAGATFAGPTQKRQDLPIGDYDETPYVPEVGAPIGDATPVEDPTYDQPAKVADVVEMATATAAVQVVRRQEVTCTSRSYNGPQVVSPTDSPEAFQSYAPFASLASSAPVPLGYAAVPRFSNLKATAMDSSYLTYTTRGLSNYDPTICAAKCDTMAGCNAFNIYYERVPLVVSTKTQVPDNTLCPAFANSTSATLLKCAFYGMPIKASQATNVGQFQGKFRVVMAGSNAYTKNSAPTVPGFQGPVSFGNFTINAPAPVKDHGYLRVQTFGQDVPYDPSLCAASCQAQTEYNKAHPNIHLGPCIFFDAYILYKNGQSGILTCTYYSTAYGSVYAKNKGQFDATGNWFNPAMSNGYYLDGNYVE